jgi:hypothetical protein
MVRVTTTVPGTTAGSPTSAPPVSPRVTSWNDPWIESTPADNDRRKRVPDQLDGASLLKHLRSSLSYSQQMTDPSHVIAQASSTTY